MNYQDSQDDTLIDQKYFIGTMFGIGIMALPFFVYQCSKVGKSAINLIIDAKETKRQAFAEIENYAARRFSAPSQYTETVKGRYKTSWGIKHPHKVLYNPQEYDELCIMDRQKNDARQVYNKVLDDIDKTKYAVNKEVQRTKHNRDNNIIPKNAVQLPHQEIRCMYCDNGNHITKITKDGGNKQYCSKCDKWT